MDVPLWPMKGAGIKTANEVMSGEGDATGDMKNMLRMYQQETNITSSIFQLQYILRL